MPRKYYLDTAIWMDLHENRTDRFRPLGEWAFQLLGVIRRSRGKILYSDMVVEELMRGYDENTIKKIFDNVAGFLEKVNVEKHHVKNAAILCQKENLPFGDALHAVLAGDNDAILVTRDHHFENLQDIAIIKKPEDLI